jgi:hypothetical protein
MQELDLTADIIAAELLTKQAKEKRDNFWADKVGGGIKVSAFDTFILYYAKNAAEVRKVLESLETYRDMGEIGTAGSKHYTTAPTRYRIDISNNYYDNYLEIKFGLLNIDVHIRLDFNVMDESTILFFSKGSRGLYETETHYVNLQAHTKEFKDRRVRSFGFGNYKVISWYGGNHTLLDSERIAGIINHFLNYGNDN